MSGAWATYAGRVQVAALGLSVLKGSAQQHPRALRLAHHGPVGDRAFCCVDAGAARVLRTVENPRLVALRAGLRRADAAGDVLRVEVPGRAPVESPVVVTGALRADYWGRQRDLDVLGGPFAAVLSDWLGRDVVLARARPRDVVYGGGVTVVTTSSLREVARRAGTGQRPEDLVADAERWRATAVLDTGDAPPFVEDGWVGTRLRLGEVEVEVGRAVARCAVVRLRPGSGEREEWDPLRLLAPDRTPEREVVFGVEAEVRRPGTVTVGDPVRLG